MSQLTYCFLARYLRYWKKIILGISNICLWLFFSNVLISNQNPSKSTDSYMSLLKAAFEVDCYCPYYNKLSNVLFYWVIRSKTRL